MKGTHGGYSERTSLRKQRRLYILPLKLAIVTAAAAAAADAADAADAAAAAVLVLVVL